MSMKSETIETTDLERQVIENATAFVVKMKTPDGTINRRTNGLTAMKAYVEGLVEKHGRGARVYAQAKIDGVLQGALCAVMTPNKGWKFAEGMEN